MAPVSDTGSAASWSDQVQPLHQRLADDFALVCFSGFPVAELEGLLAGRCGILAFVKLHDGVGDDGQQQDGQQDVQFVLQAQEGAVGEGDDETQRLPHTVVSKCCLFVPGEEDAIKSCGTGRSTEWRLRPPAALIICVICDYLMIW